ncbi:hypothetical protein FPV67DRAFT_1417372, partial [Lyophyllum atratum]
GAAYNSQDRYPPPKCHPGTREPILKEVYEWIENSVMTKVGSLMWLHGPAGAGKSAIAQTVAETCAERGQLAASFFFSRGSYRRDTITFPGLVYFPGVFARRPRATFLPCGGSISAQIFLYQGAFWTIYII